jgi:3-oxoacyl-[acyl-carrier-protein] synthase-3
MTGHNICNVCPIVRVASFRENCLLAATNVALHCVIDTLGFEYLREPLVSKLRRLPFIPGLLFHMRFNNVCIESIGYCLPEERITSDEIESRLEPLYRRLKLPQGRLELITSIRERRFWTPGTLPSDKSIESGRLALEAAGINAASVGALIHASVCRDHLEPATACRVHCELGLPQECMIYDVSNACLGLMNGTLQIAQLIEAGVIHAGLVVGTESSRQLVETTINTLNNDTSLTRASIKSAIASLTIGSASCAILLTHRDVSNTGNLLSAGVARANTKHHRLCHSGADEAVASGMQPLMETDSETLMREGVATGAATFETFLAESGWSRDDISKTVCHQVGKTHRKMMLDALGVPIERDFATVEWLGNTGSVALPITLAVAAEQEHLQANDQVAMLGIGSGINSLMLAVNWQNSLVSGHDPLSASQAAAK